LYSSNLLKTKAERWRNRFGRNNMDSDSEILTGALEIAALAYRRQIPNRTLLGPDPDRAVMDPVCAAIERCTAFKAVAGHMLFSGGSGPVLDAPSLATRLFDKGVGWGEDIPGAVAWLLRLLNTRTAPGFFKTAIWGLSIDAEMSLTDSARLMPFAALPDSHMQRRISNWAKPCYDGSAWLSHSYYDVPGAALVRELSSFPYIGTDYAPFAKIAELEQEASDFWTLVEAASVGHPLAIGCWFEWADRDLEFSEWENTINWILPEIPPRVSRSTPVDMRAIQENLGNYAALPANLQSVILRSMKRFALSQCRHQPIDHVLDLALAFEIAVSGEGDHAPPGWKVSVRSTQLIGGTLEKRQANRATISALYDLRNKATHGSELASQSVEKTLQDSSALYITLVKNILSLRQKPDWKSLELEPRASS
jgi:Apea-like HEPN